ncbi:MAG TPA: TetR/AcrR family transcriptional regulator [Jatrophihabitantaceae bacterium]|jgi:AcrR family transcriptional regulator
MTATAPADTEVRRRILSAAVDLFADHGYDATSVSQVINRAGVAKGGFYHHFASKDELLYAVYGELINRQVEGMQRILAEKLSPAETLRRLIMDLVETTAASAREALVFSRELSQLGNARIMQMRSQRRKYHNAMIKLVREAQERGQFSPVASPEIVTFTVFGVINEMPRWYRPAGRMRPEQIATEIADLVLAGLHAEETDI